MLHQEELLWYQKSRVDWLHDGDRNTTFFQLSTIVRRWKNKVTALKDAQDQWIHDKHEVKLLLVDYFKTLFTEEEVDGPMAIPSGVCSELSNEDWANLTRPFTQSDIDQAVNSMGSLKAPGPDGFQALFYQKNWETVAPKMYTMALDALAGKGLPPSINETFLALIPKDDNPESPSQFRPIGLCNVTYKIITKAIVNRIKAIMPKITSCTQTSFVPGRQITDNIVIVQEVLHTMRRKKSGKQYMTIKIDFEKAYDRLKWSFIRDTLVEMNFPLRLIEVIMECVTTASMRILWNGEKTESFTPSRGVTQGDPLSPYLFVLCMERLNQIIEEAIIAGNWIPIHASRGGPLLSNLFFADDIILFAEASPTQAYVIQDCLNRFCAASGQKVSIRKSTIYYSHNTAEYIKDEISAILGMDTTTDLGLYLGMPTLTSRVTRDTYAHLCEKIDRRLTGWKSKYLSLAGRITLAKSTLSTMANYSMQTARIPRGVCDEIDKKVRRFVWGGNAESNRVHLLSWDTLQRPRKEGGIELRSARQSNAAFLTKLGWRMLTEPNSLWSSVLRHKYCRGRCDIDMFQPTSNMSNVWKEITDNAAWLKKGSAVAIGNGQITLFWDHCWATNIPLRSLAVASIPTELDGATVEEMWMVRIGWRWDSFSNLLPVDVIKRIEAHKLIENPEVGDLRYWKGSTSGKFSIKHAISLMREDPPRDNPKWDLIWRVPAQQRIRTFLWLTLHDRILCNANRAKRHLTDDPRCHRCVLDEDETMLHLLRDCPAARVIWEAIGGPPHLPSFFTGSLEHWIIQNIQAIGHIYPADWASWFCTTLWWNWRWRNGFTYGRSEDIPIDVGTFLRARMEENWRAFYCQDPIAPPRGHLPHVRREVYVRWIAPPMDWIVLNTDGAARGCPGLAGGGGLLRDSRGIFVKGFAAHFGVCSAYKAELLAVELGLHMARALNIHKLLIQMDNKACLEGLQNPALQGGECVHILNSCRQIIDSFSCNISFLHCYREGNKVADALANIGVVLGEKCVFYETPPPSIAHLLREDIMGVTSARLVS